MHVFVHPNDVFAPILHEVGEFDLLDYSVDILNVYVRIVFVGYIDATMTVNSDPVFMHNG
jgi:hypothetical protein